MKLTNDWITGFIDGDGCFSISKMPASKEFKGGNATGLRFRFIASQDQRSADVLYALKKHFGCGTVYKSSGNMMDYCITNRLHLRDKVLPHFVKYPLQTMKRIRFYEFATALRDYMGKLGEDPGISVDSLYVSAEYKCTAGWFRGIVDADGCFSFSVSAGQCMPRFTLGMQRGESPLIKECQRLVRCGTLHTRKDGLETLQVASVAHMEQFLIPFFETRGSAVLLRTIKRISFQKWRKIVRLITEKRHLDAAGMEKILKYKQGLNTHNQSIGYVESDTAELSTVGKVDNTINTLQTLRGSWVINEVDR